MKIWFDITHLAQYNFYKNSIIRFSKKNKIYVTLLKRGVLPIIVNKEIGDIPNVKIRVIGCHRGTRFSAIVEANLIRLVKLFFWSLNKQIDVSFSNGFSSSLIGLFSKQKTYTFGDDPDTFDFKPKLWFSTISHYCIYENPKSRKLSKNIVILKTLKEWAYLGEEYFTPNIKVLEKYNVRPYNYLFFREVITGTINYKGQKDLLLLDIVKYFPDHYPVLLSLEDKTNIGLYPINWKILQEPISDIHSLIYYSRGLISSGDSMAREASLLGVSSYYMGVRDMPANRVAGKKGQLRMSKDISVNKWLDSVLSRDVNVLMKSQMMIRKSINEDFIDVIDYMEKFIK